MKDGVVVDTEDALLSTLVLTRALLVCVLMVACGSPSSSDSGTGGGSASGGGTGQSGNGGGSAVSRSDGGIDPCVVGTVPPSLRSAWGLSSFYVKHVDLRGFPIMSSDKVSDRALCTAYDVVAHMLLARPELIDRLVARKIRLAIMAPTEVTTDIPEHSDLTPKDFWDMRARGLGATLFRPAVSAAEENVLCLDTDRYRGESILVHEFSHAIFNMAIELDEPAQGRELDASYAAAIDGGLFSNTYAGTNRDEYWAEGAQNWFDTNATAVPSNGIHNEIHTRAQLQTYDPRLSALLQSVFGPSSWKYSCPAP